MEALQVILPITTMLILAVAITKLLYKNQSLWNDNVALTNLTKELLKQQQELEEENEKLKAEKKCLCDSKSINGKCC